MPALHYQAQVGQAVTIDLEAMPGAALIWDAPPAPSDCTLSRAEGVQTGADIGGPALQRFILVCRTPGRLELRFEKKRPWEAIVRAVQPVSVDVS